MCFYVYYELNSLNVSKTIISNNQLKFKQIKTKFIQLNEHEI